MELDDLKSKWRELDERFDGANAKIDTLAAQVATGKLTPVRQRLLRMHRMVILMLTFMPLCFVNIFRAGPEKPGTALLVLLGVFVCAMLAQQIVLSTLLRRIDPVGQSIRDACAAVLRYRRCYLAGTVAGVSLAVPVVVLLGLYLGRLTTPYTMYGFVAGLVVGIPLGVRIFLRALGEINALRDALHEPQG